MINVYWDAAVLIYLPEGKYIENSTPGIGVHGYPEIGKRRSVNRLEIPDKFDISVPICSLCLLCKCGEIFCMQTKLWAYLVQSVYEKFLDSCYKLHGVYILLTK